MKFVSSFILIFLFSTAFAETVDKIIAVVNNEIVLQSDVTAFSKKIERGEMVDDLLLFGDKIEILKTSPQKKLNYLVNEKILASEIKRLNLSVTVERVEQEIRDIAKRNGVTRNDLMSAIRAQGMTASDYQDFIKTRVERQSLIEQEISSKIRVSDEDIMADYIRNNPTSSAGSYEYTLAHILFNPKKGGAQAAKERAEKVLKRIRFGESFETLAEQTSEDSNFSSGGLLGTLKTGEFNQQMEQAVQNLDPNEVSEIVQTKAGFHILKVIGKKVGMDANYEKQKEKIRSTLFERAFQKHFKNWLETKREDSFVRINQ
jgi:peptidyl-prolyl cis-trans isomerase SurA